MRRAALLFVVLALVSIAVAQSRGMHKNIVNARTILVCTEAGPDVAPNRISLDEQRVLGDVEDRLRKWDRFKLTSHEEDADLIMIVRKGGVSVQLGGGAPIPGMPPIVRTPGGPTSPVDDLLEIYDGRGVGIRGNALWSGHERGGLSGRLPLLSKFQAEVDKASPKP